MTTLTQIIFTGNHCCKLISREREREVATILAARVILFFVLEDVMCCKSRGNYVCVLSYYCSIFI